MLHYYQELLKHLNKDIPFLKYLDDPLLIRLKKVGYFCGMDYASKDVYLFSEYINRYNHSLNVALITYYLTKDKTQALAALYHDVSTPCFSHVIDYMNKDYLKQESTENKTKDILLKDSYLKRLLKYDGINLDDVINFKKYSIVDNNRPKLCADRLDAVILNSIGWIKNITKEDIAEILGSIFVVANEFNEQEIAFKDIDVANKVKSLNSQINEEMHSDYDIYMMELLANIVKKAIESGLITYDELYIKTEDELIAALLATKDENLKILMDEFLNVKKDDIPPFNINVKNRDLSPLVRQRRI
jgi:HD superfamily phosphohydrolase